MKKTITMILALVMLLMMAVPAFAAEAQDNPFVDLKPGKFYYDAVLWAVDKGITTGTGDGSTFSPDAPCTRKQIVTFLWRYAGSPDPASMENPFTDVKQDRFTSAILWAYHLGITTGTGDGSTFSPDAPCTRKQIVTFLWRYFGEPEVDVSDNPFEDVKQDRFEMPIMWALKNGITTGKTASTFLPEDTCTRSQIVTFLYRADDRQPIWINDTEAATACVLPKGKTEYYTGYLFNITLHIENAQGLTLNFNGETYTPDENGKLEVYFPAAAGMGRPMPVEFSVTNASDAEKAIEITFQYPVGESTNPAQLVIGENTAPIAANDMDGYYYTWTAEEDGELSIYMPYDMNWFYVINNLTSFSYGDSQWSDSDPIANPAVVPVKAGDEIQLIVNTYDPNSWNTPAADLVFSASFAPPAGTAENPHMIIDASEPVNAAVPAGKTVYYTGYIFNMTMTMEDAAGVTFEFNGEKYTADESGKIEVVFPPAVGMGRPMPVTFTITNGNETDGEYVMVFKLPLGEMDNPAQLVIGENTAPIAANDMDGYYYTWTAEEDGELSIYMPYDMHWFYVINNLTSYSYGDSQWSDSDPVVNPAVISVKAGDEIQLIVNTYDPNSWNTPAADLVFSASFAPPAGTAENPHMIIDASEPVNAAVPAGKTVYYTGYIFNMTMTMEDAAGVTFAFNGEKYTADESGKIEVVFPPAVGMGRPLPVTFSITNGNETDGEYVMVFKLPLGEMDNPALLVIGENTAPIAANDMDGYYYTWTAEGDGTLTITLPSDMHWFYVINNLTSFSYGDSQWSDSDPVVNTTDVAVKAGDEIQLIVNTYDPNSWNTPAGELSFTAEFVNN